MSDAPKRFLFVVREGPGCESLFGETLDIILTVAAFDQVVRVLFIDDGVLYVSAATAPLSPRDSQIRATLQALDLYDVHEVLVGRESLFERGLAERAVCLAATIVPEEQVRALIAEHERILVC